MTPAPVPSPIWTIGHWTRPQEAFLGPLREQEIDVVVDVRAHPGSRSTPHFGRDQIPKWLTDNGIGYQHIEELGGRRPKQPDIDPALNAGWRNQSFHKYADYTRTEPFRRGLDQLISLAADHRVTLLCGEPMPWRCHRLLVANVLTAHGRPVEHLFTDRPPTPHEFGRWGAQPLVEADGNVRYPGPLEGSV